MLTTNLLQFAEELTRLGPVTVKDTNGQVVLNVPPAVDIQQVDDLVCDAVFVDPEERVPDGGGWVIYLTKREHNRPSADAMQVRQEGAHFHYLLSGRAA